MTNCGRCGEEQAGVGLLCRRCGAPVASPPSATSATPEAIPNQPPFAPWGTPPNTPPPTAPSDDIVFQPRKPRWPWIVALVAALVVAGVVVFASVNGGSSTDTRPKNVTVHLGNQPEVDPVNRLFSSMFGTKFDRAMFLSAFDMKHDSCGLASAMKQGGLPVAENTSPPWTASVKSTGAGTALVSLHGDGTDTMDFAVSEVSGHWVIDQWVLPNNVQMPLSFNGSPCDIYSVLAGASQVARDRGTQSDLRNALTAEKVEYTDAQAYSDEIATMRGIESSLAWGTKLTVTVGTVDVLPGAQIVCLSETGSDGKTYALADVAAGDNVGTYYGTQTCPSNPTAAAMAAMGTTPWGEGGPKTTVDAQSDLRNALTAEKTVYTDQQTYSADTKNMKSIESSLDWGGKLTVRVSSDSQTVCLSEPDASGAISSIADVAAGPTAGTYYGHATCPDVPTAQTPLAQGWETSW
jgi:hypothetical protein